MLSTLFFLVRKRHRGNHAVRPLRQWGCGEVPELKVACVRTQSEFSESQTI